LVNKSTCPEPSDSSRVEKEDDGPNGVAAPFPLVVAQLATTSAHTRVLAICLIDSSANSLQDNAHRPLHPETAPSGPRTS